jgi:hypothetical protein
MKMEIIDFTMKMEIIDYILEEIIDFIVKMRKHHIFKFANLLPSGGICD